MVLLNQVKGSLFGGFQPKEKMNADLAKIIKFLAKINVVPIRIVPIWHIVWFKGKIFMPKAERPQLLKSPQGDQLN
jgi:hypothetical protein